MKKRLLFLSALCLLTGCAGGVADPSTEAGPPTAVPTAPATLPKTAADVEPGENEFLFRLDLSERGEKINNKVSDVNVWMFQSSCLDGWDENHFREEFPFVERIQFMQATGGNAERDLFLDPYDASVRDDYKFDELIAACKNVLAQGVKPMIKTGNVPMKFSTVNTPGVLGVNMYPPDDYNEYYGYICDVAASLVAEFGREEVASWRWGVLTEYENKDWFSYDESEEATFEAYCRLYDTTAAALQSVLGEEINIGAHSMTVAEGLWDEERFIEHCASGTNFWTGETGSPLTYLAVSFYDTTIPNSPRAAKSLPDTIQKVRAAAEAAGMTELIYGVDEGRILVGVKGSQAADLTSRVVGDTAQGAYDARLILQMVDNDIDYFSAWGYTTAGLRDGIPTVSLHVAREFYKMVGSARVGVEKAFKTPGATEYEALASVGDDGTLRMMAYTFGRGGEDTVPLRFAADLGAARAQVRLVRIDDDANFFDEWRADCEAAEIGAEHFSWSPDSSEPPIITDEARALWEENSGKYAAAAELKEEVYVVETEGGLLDLTVEIPRSSVVFLTVKPLY